MSRDKRKVEEALSHKGFVRQEGDHHFFVYFTLGGKKSRSRTKTSHTPKMKDLNEGLLGRMARQCGLTKPEFLDLVDCPLTREGFEKLLAERDGL